MTEAAAHEAGIAFVWEGRAERHLRLGRLERCLSDCARILPISAYTIRAEGMFRRPLGC
jgi:hypothetical protein